MTEIRKLQLVGNRSYAVCLPKTWVTAHKLKAQDSVFITESDDGQLYVTVAQKKFEQSRTVEVALSEIQDISHFLFLCYIKQVKTIVFTAKRFDPKVMVEIQKTIDVIDGYEITEESAKRVQISFLYRDIDISVNKLLYRMHYLLTLQAEALFEKNESSLKNLEQSTDRVYYFASRVLSRCAQEKEYSVENGIHSFESISFYQNIFKKLESFGDLICRIYEYCEEHPTHAKIISAQLEKMLPQYLEMILASIKKKSISFAKHKSLKSAKNPFEHPSMRTLWNAIHELAEGIFVQFKNIYIDSQYFSGSKN